jgi:1-acyl-sn-glycerol-3-phosphate acyltransferase
VKPVPDPQTAARRRIRPRSGPAPTLSALLGSTLFALLQLVVTPPYALVSILSFPLPPLVRYRIITSWSRLMVAAARLLCGIRYRVIGREHLPPNPCIVLAKHQSAWETLAFQVLLPPQAIVLKRELLWIPFFGWGLAMLSPIAIDRGSGARALRRMAAQGRDRLAAGFWIVVFPEGTRMPPGMRGRYQVGGAWLATKTGARVVPIAHNAGHCWPKGAFLKRAGLVTVSIGPPIATQDRDPQAVIRDVENWIEGEMQRLPHHA